MDREIISRAFRAGKPLYRAFYRKSRLFGHILIQTNDICTRKCPWCYFGIIEKTTKEQMEESVFKKIIGDLERLDFKGRVSLFETNEFLTDKRIFKFLQYAAGKLPKAWFFLNTNGDLLRENTIDKLFQCGLDELHISCYDDKAWMKGKSLSEKAREKRVRVFDKRNGWFITSNRGGSLEKQDKPKSLDLFCDRVNKIMYVKPNGKVVACFEDFFSVNVMGDVKEENLEEIWFGKKFSTFRNLLMEGRRLENPLCRRCNYLGFGGHYKAPIIAHRKKKQKRQAA